MREMLEQLLRHLNNWFLIEDDLGKPQIFCGTYEVKGGGMFLPFLQPNQFYRIVGSVFNDGLHRYCDPEDYLQDETFTGAIWALAIPTAVINISSEIETWQQANALSPYQSESFGGYAYQRASGRNGKAATWQDVFAHKLNAWRKI